MKKFTKGFLSFLIPAFTVMLFWALTNNNILLFVLFGIPHGVVMGIGYLLLELYVIKKINKNIWIKRIGLFLTLFTLTTILYFMLNYQEVIRPIKSIFNNEMPVPADFYDDNE